MSEMPTKKESTKTTGAAGVRLRQDTCTCLRWKGMYIDAEPDVAVPNTSDGLYWCVHTMTVLGPDGKVADREACTVGRGCFEVCGD